MRQIYRKIDKLEVRMHWDGHPSVPYPLLFGSVLNAGALFFPWKAFVKMVGANVNAMDEQVTQAEGEVGTLPGAFKKIFRTMSVPGFLNVRHNTEILA